jgi:hypothetical protein
MKQNNIKEIERQLTSKSEFSVSKDFANRVLQSAALQTRERETAPAFRWKKVFAPIAAVAACMALFIVVKPVGTPAIAAEKFFARAADFFNTVSGYRVEFGVRTYSNENFSYTNPAKGFVDHTMTVASDGRWKLDKGGRVAENDGSNIYVWFPEKEWGWKFDPDQTGAISPFENLLDLGGLMRWLEGYVALTKGADCRKVEDARTVKLILKVPAQGDYGNDYLKFSAIDENDTKQTYVFSKEDGRLLSAEIDAKVFGFSRTILRARAIDYDITIPALSFAIPENIEWLDETSESVAVRMDELPVSEFVGIGVDEATDKLFKALNEWDEPRLKVIFRAYPLKRIEAGGFKGCKLISQGNTFKSGTYGGIFVPCQVQLATGEIKKMKLAFRNDNQWQSWEVDGGI